MKDVCCLRPSEMPSTVVKLLKFLYEGRLTPIVARKGVEGVAVSRQDDVPRFTLLCCCWFFFWFIEAGFDTIC